VEKNTEKANGKHGKQARESGLGKGLVLARMFSRPGVDPLNEVKYESRDSVITDPDGTIVFQLKNAEIPSGWSQLATDIAVSKYFRKAGINGDPKRGETSARDLVYRVARTIREAGEKFGGYFASVEDADSFEAELSHILITQKGALTRPYGSTAASFSATASRGRAATGPSIPSWAPPWRPPTPMSNPSAPPASSRASRTT